MIILIVLMNWRDSCPLCRRRIVFDDYFVDGSRKVDFQHGLGVLPILKKKGADQKFVNFWKMGKAAKVYPIYD